MDDIDIPNLMKEAIVAIAREYKELLQDKSTKMLALRYIGELRGYCRDLHDIRGSTKSADADRRDQIHIMIDNLKDGRSAIQDSK